MRIPDHLTCLLRNLYAGEATELNMEQLTASKLGKEYNKAVYCHPAYLISVQTTLMAEGKEELKSLLMKVKQQSEKAALNLNIEKTKIMASGPITSWEIDGETVETVSDFVLGGSKVTADGDCSHEVKRRLLLGRKVMTNLDNVLISRDITLLTKVHTVKAMVFSLVMYGCESWTIKKAEC